MSISEDGLPFDSPRVAASLARVARSGRLVPAVLLLMTACNGATQASSGTPGSRTTATTSAVSASPSESEIRGCVPACSTGFSDPGPIGPGPYTTAAFLDGQLTVTYPSRWESHEDQGVEFSSSPAGKWDVHRVLFWDDILPWDPRGHVVTSVHNTAAGWVEWLSSNPIVTVTSPRHATITRMRLPATYVDVADAPGGTRFPDVITWPNAGGNVYGIGGDFVFRLYLAEITYGGRDHLLAVAVEGQDSEDLNAFLPEAKKLIASADAPIEAT